MSGNITAADILKAIFSQVDEDGVETVFRTHIMRNWERGRIEKFCLHLLGDKAQQLWIGDQDNKIYAWLDEKTGFISASPGGPYTTPLYRRPITE